MQGRRFELTALAVALAALLCFIWLAQKVDHGETVRFDESVRNALHSAARPWLTTLFEAITALGSQAVVTGVSGSAALILFRQGRRAEALLIVIAMGGAEAWLYLLKAHFHRQRPEPFFGLAPLTSYSFPSGHALLSFCCYGMLAALAPARRALVRIAAAALILAIGLSRIYLGVHHASDVIAGYLVAAAWMAGLAALYTRIVNMKR
jgi:undecaprenyl-diphosphatase